MYSYYKHLSEEPWSSLLLLKLALAGMQRGMISRADPMCIRSDGHEERCCADGGGHGDGIPARADD